MAFRVQEFSTKYLDVGGSPDVQIIGICGMGGIGKTTLARAIFSKYHHSFNSQCYLEEVSKKKNMVGLQEQLLRDILKQPDIKVSSVAEGTNEIEKRLGSMKVLIVVDDIDDADQLDELAIEHKSFGPGSRIIITTRDEQVLNIQKVDKRYKAQAMTKKEALKLLSWHAFGNDYPDKEYIELARDIIDYCGGLPLALKVVGRLLATKKSKTIWESTLDKLRNIPDGKIHETLKLSYDGLPDDHVKGVFLDISHFYIETDKSITTAILNDCSNFRVEAEITTLCDRCLLYIGKDKTLRMHDLIRDMGREIVRAESPVELGKRSRLWHNEDAKSVLRNESGTEAVEGLKLLLPEDSDEEQSFSTEAFKKMRRLKFLQLGNVKLTGSYKRLSKELRALSWIGFPLEAIPADFDQRKLVCMLLRHSKIVRVWEDSDLLPKKLKYLFLKDCHHLTELPDFSKLPHLEILILSGCKGLCGGYHFLAQLKMIEVLKLNDCKITDGAVLKIIGSLSSLTYLDLGGNGFNRLPILSGLSQLRELRLNYCTNLQAISDLPNSLLKLKANYCTALEIMSDFSEMSKMRKLELKDCRKLKDIPNLENSMDYMDSIHMDGCTSLTGTFKEKLQTKNAFGGISLSGNDIPNRLAYVARKGETVKFKVPPSIDYIGGLALGIVYSSDNSDSTGSLYIDFANLAQRTYFRICPMEAIVTASHEDYLWLGNLSNKKLNLKGGDTIHVRAKFYEGDNRIKVNKTGVNIVKWDLSDGRTNWNTYVTMPYESYEDTTMSYEFDEDTDDDIQLSNRHVFLCYKTPEAWPWSIEGSESDPLPKFFGSALKTSKNDITVKTLLTVIEGREGTEFSDGDVLIFPQMIKYRGLKESDVDSFVDDVLVNHKSWASGVQEPLTGSHVFVCTHCSREEWNRDGARVLIDKFEEEAELRGLTNQLFVTACYHTGGHNGNLIIYSPGSDGSITGHWYGYVTPADVPEMLDRHIGKGEIIQRLWRTTSIYRGSTGSDVSDESSSSSLGNAMYKPHKANDIRWEVVQAARSHHNGTLGKEHFKLLRTLGCGDIGSVYLAELIGSETYFAMKVMDKALLASRKKLLRAQTEREILQSLDHPFLPTLYTHFETEKVSCLVMEFCPGGDLHALRQKQPGKHFSEHAARFYVAEVLLALEYLHMLGIIYRDLIPENVLVREDGHIMLSDFDLSLRCSVSPTLVRSSNLGLETKKSAYCVQPACIQPTCVMQPDCITPACFGPRFFKGKPKKDKNTKLKKNDNDVYNQVSPLPELVAEPTSARSMSFVGTHEYLAPEIIKGEGHGNAVDWWTLGIFLYELLFGRTPFKGEGNRATLFNVVGQPLRFPESPSVSFAARDLIRGLLVKEPQHRLAYRRGATEVKQHPFFQSVNWALIRCTTPPQVPKHYILETPGTPKEPINGKMPGVDLKPSVNCLEIDFF
ncbi:uncharacterized protein LOC103956653 isoform X2 [Pyrus x bretschneideri]|uniref:uncharacterized protein LOC103956653 isoform X2 n=1 Tax=Pyrus x bretschneideri TaxID=225117 RepID=UPI00202FC81B|nr:uncharacterized protein LOC103956653 isoform X2 [Pyrus x bretschneideri]